MGYIENLMVGHRPLILPRVAVLGIDGQKRVLLQRQGLWGVPGGFMELGESAEETARREVKEETGINVSQRSLITVDSGKDTFVKLPNGDEFYV